MDNAPRAEVRVAARAAEGPYDAVRLATRRGDVSARHYAVRGATRAVVWVGGVAGGWDSPARDLYPRLAEALAREDGIASLRVRFRSPGRLLESEHDVLAGLRFLAEDGVERFALCGHSFGGAVVFRAAAADERVRAVVTLATQAYGADAVARVAGRAAVLLVHGTADTILPAAASARVHALAPEPKRLVLAEGAGHVLDEAANVVEAETRDWLRAYL